MGELRFATADVVGFNSRPEHSGRPRDSRYSDLLLPLEFSSDVDFIRLANKYEYNMYIEMRWCKEGNDGLEISDGFSDFYLGDLEVRGPALNESRYLFLAKAAGGRFVYHAYFHVTQPKYVYRMSRGIKETYPPYDIAAQPEDICLLVRGGNVIGGRGSSGVVVLPKKAIAEALLRYEKK